MALRRTALETLDDNKTPAEKFTRQFDAYVTDSKEYRQHVRSMPRWSAESIESIYNIEFKTEPLVAVHLPKEQFHRLVDHLSRIDELTHRQVDAINLLDQQRKDQRVRDENPAVQKAWTNYKTLLELSRK